MGYQAFLDMRFQNDVPDAVEQGSCRDGLIGISSNQHNRGVLPGRPQAANEVKSVHSFHLVVDDEAVRRFAGGAGKAIGTAAEGSDLEALGLQEETQGAENVPIVIDDINECLSG